VSRGSSADRLAILGQAAPPRERADAARNRELIVKAARKMFRRGRTLCMDALAEEAGVGKGTLYRRFPDRAALIHGLLDEDARALQAHALAGCGLGAGCGRAEHAVALLGAIFDFVADHAPLLCEAQAGHRTEQRFDHPAMVWQRQMIAGLLRAAIRGREIAPLDPGVTAELLLAAVDPDRVAWLLEQHSEATLRAELLAFARRAIGA
jgi:AcrR family transcriptional regulator